MNKLGIGAIVSALYEGLGQLTQDERALVVFSGVVGSLGVVAAAVWVARTIHATAGLWTGILVAVLPEHVAWSTSAYNVILPLTLLLWSLVLRGRWSFILAAAAVSMRAELVLLAPLAGWPAMLGGGVGRQRCGHRRVYSARAARRLARQGTARGDAPGTTHFSSISLWLS